MTTRQLLGITLDVFDIPYGERIIWGATAGMLLTLRRLLQEQPRGSDSP